MNVEPALILTFQDLVWTKSVPRWRSLVFLTTAWQLLNDPRWLLPNRGRCTPTPFKHANRSLSTCWTFGNDMRGLALSGLVPGAGFPTGWFKHKRAPVKRWFWVTLILFGSVGGKHQIVLVRRNQPLPWNSTTAPRGKEVESSLPQRFPLCKRGEKCLEKAIKLDVRWCGVFWNRFEKREERVEGPQPAVGSHFGGKS